MNRIAFILLFYITGCAQPYINSGQSSQIINSFIIGYWKVIHYKDGSTEMRDTIDLKSYFKHKINSFEGPKSMKHVFKKAPKITKHKNKVIINWSDYIVETWSRKENKLNWEVKVLNNPNEPLLDKKRIKQINLDVNHNLNWLIVNGLFTFTKDGQDGDYPVAKFSVWTDIKSSAQSGKSFAGYEVDSFWYHTKRPIYPTVINFEFF